MDSEKLNEWDCDFLNLAYQQALTSLRAGGVPVGAALALGDKLLAVGHNKRVQENSMIKHGETDCLENTNRQVPPEIMQHATLYTTLSPCFMCAGAILNNKIPRVVIGDNQNFEESEAFLRAQGVDVIVINDAACIEMMASFIKNNPKLWGEDIGLTEAQLGD